MKNNFVFRLVCYGAYMVCRLLWFTYRYKYTGVENLRKARSMHPSGSFVLAIWHEYAIPGILSQVGEPYCVLISSSKDGELIDFVCRRIGLISVRGSSTRGGLAARNEMVALILKGTPVAVTVDGPKGPRKKCKPGVVDMARHTGVPILPVALSFHSPWVFKKSWDQTKLPWPFSSIVFRYGEPFLVPAQLTQDEFSMVQRQVDESLNKLEEEAQRDLQAWPRLPSRKAEKAL